MAVIVLCYCVTLWHISIRTGNISGTKYVLNDFPFRGPALYCSTAHDSRMTAAFRPGKSVVFLRYSDGGRKDPARKGQAHPRHFLRLHINFRRGHKTKRDALRPFYFRGFKSPLFKNGIYALDAGAHKGGQHKLLHAEVCALDGIFFAQVVHLIVLVGALGIIAAADADGGNAPAMITGKLAWMLLLLLTIFALLKRNPGNIRWRKLHIVLAVSVFIAAIFHTVSAVVF